MRNSITGKNFPEEQDEVVSNGKGPLPEIASKSR
jgi:hypothetical protein